MIAQTDISRKMWKRDFHFRILRKSLSPLNEKGASEQSHGRRERDPEPRRKLAFAYCVLIRVSDPYSIYTDPDPAF
jgi:hypothetical protein